MTKTRAKGSSGRLIGRLVFCVWAALLWGTVGAKAAPVTTLVQGPLYRADGSVARGKITIRWNEFSTSAGEAVAAGEMTVETDANGGFSVPLIPNTGASPVGSYYRVVPNLDKGVPREEVWVVPAVATTTVAAVRAKIVPQAVAAQFVGRDYVDTALAQVVHLAGAETIQGAKTFVPSPEVPAPTAAGGAANKGYVDQAIAGLATVASTGNYNDLMNKPASASLASPGAIGSITPGPVNATVYTVNGAPLASANLSDGALLAKASTTINGYPISSNITLSASNLTMGALPNGTTATTQAIHDNSTKLATTQYVDSSLAATGSNGGTTPGPVNATTVTASGSVVAGTGNTTSIGSSGVIFPDGSLQVTAATSGSGGSGGASLGPNTFTGAQTVGTTSSATSIDPVTGVNTPRVTISGGSPTLINVTGQQVAQLPASTYTIAGTTYSNAVGDWRYVSDGLTAADCTTGGGPVSHGCTWNGSAWMPVVTVGPAGTPGANGNTIWNGGGAPSSGTGVNGDFYLNTTNLCMYGPKASGTWPGGCTSLVGPTGATPTPVDLGTLTYNAGGTTTMALASSPWAAGMVTVAHSTSSTLAITGPVKWGSYVLEIKQDSTGGGTTLTLGSGCTWKMGGGGVGAITLSTPGNALDVLAFTYDGTNCVANFRTNFN